MDPLAPCSPGRSWAIGFGRCLLGVTACLPACGGQPAAEPTARPDVVLIVVDTLRADRLPFHGCSIDTAPFLGELAAGGLVFDNAWSPSSWTLPATVSLLTSVHPFQHGVFSLEGLENGPDDPTEPVNRIPDEVQTLAETLRAEGYRTFGIASNILVGKEVGFDRGFDHFLQLGDQDAARVNAELAAWSDELNADGPTFLYLHYFDPHDPFHAREPWFDVERSKASWSGDLALGGEASHADLDWIIGQLKPPPPGLDGMTAADLSLAQTRELVDWIRAAYDSEIRYLDTHIRELQQALDLDDALLVFTADHGEEFYEHGSLTHGQNLHGETTRVPMFIRGPGVPVGRADAAVSTLDVAPTVCALLGLPTLAQHRGRDLLGDLAPRPVLQALEGKSGQHGLGSDLRAIVLDSHRLIASPAGAVGLFDIGRDPDELHDLSSDRPAVVQRLRAELDSHVREAPVYPRNMVVPADGPSPVMLEHLRGLGYLGDDG